MPEDGSAKKPTETQEVQRLSLAWDRWWARLTAAGQFGLGAWTFIHETTSTGADRLALQFWAVCLMFGAPMAGTAVQAAAEKFFGVQRKD